MCKDSLSLVLLCGMMMKAEMLDGAIAEVITKK